MTIASDLKEYKGKATSPDDFDAFWSARCKEADAEPLSWSLSEAPLPRSETLLFEELRFRGLGGQEVYAKVVRPRTQKPVPLILQFHGYPGASRGWFEQCSFPGLGFGVIAMDNPGQGGQSHDAHLYSGTTVSGHLVLGLGGSPAEQYYVRLYQTIRILCRVALELPWVERRRVYANGASQGGGLALVCAALNPSLIKKVGCLYPFLTDFRTVWELDADQIAYEGLRYYTRWFDPMGSRTEEVFTQLGYIDALNFACKVRCPVLLGTGLADTVCPPPAQFALYNRLTCSKRHMLFEGLGHEEIQEFDDTLISFYGEEDVS